MLAEELIGPRACGGHQRKGLHEFIARTWLFFRIEAVTSRQSVVQHDAMPFILSPGTRFSGGHHRAPLVRREATETEPGRRVHVHCGEVDVIRSEAESAQNLACGVEHATVI